MAKYDERFKRRGVERYLTGRAGFKALAKEMGLDPEAIRRWVGSYTHHDTIALKKVQPVRRTVQVISPAVDVA